MCVASTSHAMCNHAQYQPENRLTRQLAQMRRSAEHVHNAARFQILSVFGLGVQSVSGDHVVHTGAACRGAMMTDDPL